MGWSGVVSTGPFTESSAGSGVNSSSIELKPGETIATWFQRVDSPRTEPWSIEVFTSVDDADWGDVPIVARRYENSDRSPTIVVRGPRYVRFRFRNADGSPVDIVSVNMKHVLDTVDLSA